MNHWPFRTQILLLGAIPALIVWIAMTLHTAYNGWSHLLIEHQRHGETLVKQIAPSCEYSIFSGDMDALRTYLNQVVQQPEIDRIEIYDNQFHLLAQIEHIPSSLLEVTPGTVFTAPIHASMLSIDTWDSSNTAPAPLLGSVALTLSNNRLKESRQQLIMETLWAGLSAFVVALLLVYLLSKQLTQFLSRLKLAMGSIASGNLTPPAQNLPTEGELGEITQSLDRVSSTLERNRKEVLAAYEALELQIAESEKSTERSTPSSHPEQDDLH